MMTYSVESFGQINYTKISSVTSFNDIVSTALRTTRIAWLQLIPFLHPNWLWDVLKNNPNLFRMQCSNILEMTGLIAIPLKSSFKLVTSCNLVLRRVVHTHSLQSMSPLSVIYKTCHFCFFYDSFGKCLPILIFFSVLHSAMDCWRS